jgi:hypothetical protein
MKLRGKLRGKLEQQALEFLVSGQYKYFGLMAVNSKYFFHLGSTTSMPSPPEEYTSSADHNLRRITIRLFPNNVRYYWGECYSWWKPYGARCLVDNIGYSCSARIGGRATNFYSNSLEQ